jgi:L-cysteine desulfidase
MDSDIDVMEFLKENVKPASGCTEIGAIALGGAAAMEALLAQEPQGRNGFDPKKIERIEITLDKKLYKNAHSVSIPNTGDKKGIALAAALGALLDPTKGNLLELFSQGTEQQVNAALLLMPKVWISIDYTKASPYILTTIYYGHRSKSSVIQTRHDNVSIIETGYVSKMDRNVAFSPEPRKTISNMKLEEILQIIESISEREETELQKTIDLNMALVTEGMKGTYGMGIVKALQAMRTNGDIGDTTETKIKLAVAAAVEARMGGAPLSAMSTSGSGNMGITASVPIIVVAEERNVPIKKLYRALLLSHIIVRLSADNVGDLSILCGANNKSAFGAAAGLTYLLGGDASKITCAINGVASNIIGSACDGAKYNCTLKATTSAVIAWESALMSIYGVAMSTDGIVDDSIVETFENISVLSRGMNALDDMIIDIIRDHDQKK